MKKLLLILLMLCTCFTTVHADETQVTLTHIVPESYTLTIPASVAVNDTANFNVILSNATIPNDSKVSVSANSSNYSSGWRMKNGSSYQSYTLKNGSDDVVPNETIISLPAGDPSASVTATLTAAMQGIPTVTGTYTDNVVFTTKIDDLPCLTFSSPGSFTVSFSVKEWNGIIEYSTDAENWIAYTSDGTVINSVNNKLYFRGTGITRINSTFSIVGSDISCSGNIENLLDYQTVASGDHPTMAPLAFKNLFKGCSSLTSAPSLLATTLAQACYQSMFEGCTGLTVAPELPATTLAVACYANMFGGCTSLTTAPALPATTLAMSCYANMFLGCTSLTTAPVLPATTLADQCYTNMFLGCTNLKVSASQTGSYTIPYRIPTSGTGTPASSALSGMFSSTGGTFTSTPSINTTYYLDSSNSIVE